MCAAAFLLENPRLDSSVQNCILGLRIQHGIFLKKHALSSKTATPLILTLTLKPRPPSLFSKSTTKAFS